MGRSGDETSVFLKYVMWNFPEKVYDMVEFAITWHYMYT